MKSKYLLLVITAIMECVYFATAGRVFEAEVLAEGKLMQYLSANFTPDDKVHDYDWISFTFNRTEYDIHVMKFRRSVPGKGIKSVPMFIHARGDKTVATYQSIRPFHFSSCKDTFYWNSKQRQYKFEFVDNCVENGKKGPVTVFILTCYGITIVKQNAVLEAYSVKERFKLPAIVKTPPTFECQDKDRKSCACTCS